MQHFLIVNNANTTDDEVTIMWTIISVGWLLALFISATVFLVRSDRDRKKKAVEKPKIQKRVFDDSFCN